MRGREGKGDIQSRFEGSRPSFSIALSPNGFEIQVLLRTKQERCVPSTFCRLGTIWMELEPPPIIAMRLFLKSYLMDDVSTMSRVREERW